MAAKTPAIATIACVMAGIATFAVGIPFAMLGGFTRLHYGPDSIYAAFTADTCSQQLRGLPSCAEWMPDENAFLKLVTKQFPVVIGMWTLVGIIAASMSTSTGVILAIATVLSHNVGKKALKFFKPEMHVTEKLLLTIVRCSVPVVR